MTQEMADYIVAHYMYLMTTEEKMAWQHLSATSKATHGRTDIEAQELAREHKIHSRFLSSDRNVLRLASGGYAPFVQKAAERILHEHSEEIRFNYCPSCGRLARTPKAQQCRFCHHDWHKPDR